MCQRTHNLVPFALSTPGEVGDAAPMLIQDFVQVKAPYATVRDRLLEPTPRWLTDGATAAYAEGERLFLTSARRAAR